jgi:hypothetical protein
MSRNIPDILKCMVGVFFRQLGYIGVISVLYQLFVLYFGQFVFKFTFSCIVSVRLILLQMCLTPCDRKVSRYQLLMAW